jgi:DNA polymerase III epsilon subunit-like protein
MLKDAIIAAHNVPIDLGFVGMEFARLGQNFPSLEVIDTIQIARQYFNFRSNGLQVIAAELGIERSAAHRAMADVMTTRAVLDSLMDKLGPFTTVQFNNIGESAVVDPAALNLPPVLQEALASKRDLFISYVDQKGRETQRRITPRQIMVMQDYIYISAHCHLRDEDRSFRLDRITEIKLG